ncbi:MAG: pilus assembly PilX N-terminal domain-containing protein [Nitrospiria bacterium]
MQDRSVKTVSFKNKTKRIFRSESGIALVITLLSMALLSLLGTAALTLTEIETKISANDKVAKEALYIAEAGIEHAWAVLKTASFDDILEGPDKSKSNAADNGILPFGSKVSFGQGAYDVKVTDNKDGDSDPWNDADGRIILTSIGTASTGPQKKIELEVQKLILKPNGIRGSVTSNASIETGGNMLVDGRNHDLDGNYIQGSGTGKFGISTKNILNQSGSSDIGGTSTGTDYPPSNPGDPFILETNAAWTAPITPENALGLKGNQLKTLAQSGVNGSQYVTDPDKLTFPLEGITYVELPENDTWNANAKTGKVDFEKSTGILIVHNDSKTAVLKNTSLGTFKGILIADKIEKIHNTILGAVVTLSSEGEQIGNGNGAIRYSQAAIDNALKAGSKELISLAWREVFQ